MNNTWNKIIYKIWTPFYDSFFNNGPFLKARKEVFEDLNINRGQKVLLVGCGTGADIAFLPIEVDTTAVDYSKDMLDKAKATFHERKIHFKQMDAANLKFPNESFDIIIASLILSVVPNPSQSLVEMIRVVRPKGQIIIFDKFIAKNKNLSYGKRVIRPIITLFGTDIGIRFETLFTPFKNVLQIVVDKPIMFHGMYRKIILKRN